MERDLTDLLVMELKFMREIEFLKEDLKRRYDFSEYSAFRTIDRYNESYIHVDNLRSFLRFHGQYLIDREILQIIRRFDTDGDAKISYIEFSDFMKTSRQQMREIELENELKSRSMSEQKRGSLGVSRTNSSPLRNSTKVQSRTMSSFNGPRNVTFANETTPEKKYSPNQSRMGMSGFKTAEKSMLSSSGSPFKSQISMEIEDETIRLLKEQINLEKELEVAKEQLATRYDFNLYDAF